MVLKMISFLVLLLSPLMAVAADIATPSRNDSWSAITFLRENGDIATLGVVVTILGVVVTILLMLYNGGEKKGHEREKLNNVVERVDNVVKRVNNLRTEVKADIKDLGNKLESEAKAIIGIQERTTALENNVEKLTVKIDHSISSPSTSNDSPLSINKDGQAIAQKIDADKIFNNHWQYMKDFIEASGATIPYDVQTESMQAAASLNKVLSDEEKRIIKEAVYETSMSYEVALDIFGVMARDRILKEREASKK